MYKIFCIPESKYISAYTKYIITYKNDTFYDFLGQYIILPHSNCNIISDLNQVNRNAEYSLHKDKIYWCKEDRSFSSFEELTRFCMQWFIGNIFTGSINTEKSMPFDRDLYSNYANLNIDYPNECFEIHEIVDTTIIGVAKVCVCLPFKH